MSRPHQAHVTRTDRGWRWECRTCRIHDDGLDRETAVEDGRLHEREQTALALDQRDWDRRHRQHPDVYPANDYTGAISPWA